MNERYINVSITEYGNGIVNCFLTQSVDDGPLESQRIDLDKARKLMWELKLAGGRKEVRVNRFDRNIVSRDVYYLVNF